MFKYFGCPGISWRPNMYSVCEEHKDLSLKWEDVYPIDGELPVRRHEDKVKQ